MKREKQTMDEAKLLAMLGDPNLIARELRAFRKSAQVFSSKRAHLVARYPKRWVAVFDGKVCADARTLRELLAKLDNLGVPRRHAMIRFIDKSARKMIL